MNKKILNFHLSKYHYFFVILFFTIIEIFFINDYFNTFNGSLDHSIYIGFIKKILNPELYPSDYLIGQIKYYYTILLFIVAFIHKYTHLNIYALFFIIFFITTYLRFLGFYLLCNTVTKDEKVSYLSLFISLFSKYSFAHICFFEATFTLRNTVMPFLLFSLNHFINRKYLYSYILLGLSFLIHPMSSIYVIAMILFASLFEIKEIGIKNLLVYFLIFLFISSPIIIWQLIYSPKIPFIPDKNWLKLLKLRSPEHLFPFCWNKGIILQNILFLFGYFLSWIYKPERSIHKKIILFTTAIVIMCFAGLIFSEIIPLSIVLRLQLFRSFVFIFFFGIIYFSNLYVKMIYNNKIKYIFFALITFYLIIFNAQYYEYVFLSFILFTILILFFKRYKNNEINSKYFKSGVIILSIVLGIFIKSVFVKKTFIELLPFQLEWIDVQKWAKENTDINSPFITPPYIYFFRVESERTIYADWNEGTLLNFNPEYGYEWFRRMKKLGFKNNYVVYVNSFKCLYENGLAFPLSFRELNEKDYNEIANEIFHWDNRPDRVYVVRLKNQKELNFKKVYQNNLYIVYEINKE